MNRSTLSSPKDIVAYTQGLRRSYSHLFTDPLTQRSAEDLLAGVPARAYPYAVSSVERNMFAAGSDAKWLAAGHTFTEPAYLDYLSAVEKAITATPYTNWSGD